MMSNNIAQYDSETMQICKTGSKVFFYVPTFLQDYSALFAVSRFLPNTVWAALRETDSVATKQRGVSASMVEANFRLTFSVIDAHDSAMSSTCEARITDPEQKYFKHGDWRGTSLVASM